MSESGNDLLRECQGGPLIGHINNYLHRPDSARVCTMMDLSQASGHLKYPSSGY